MATYQIGGNMLDANGNIMEARVYGTATRMTTFLTHLKYFGCQITALTFDLNVGFTVTIDTPLPDPQVPHLGITRIA